MKIGNEIKKNSILEVIKWVTVTLLIITAIIGQYILHEYNIYIRNIIVSIFLVSAFCIFLMTKLGRLGIDFGKEAYIELKKVVWPTYQDSLNTTLIVVSVTVIISLLLWGLDTLLVYVISLGLRL